MRVDLDFFVPGAGRPAGLDGAMEPARLSGTELDLLAADAYTSAAQKAGAAKVVSLPVLGRLGHILYSPRHSLASTYADDVFSLWMDVWIETFTEVGSKPPTSSDEFVLQDEICTLHDDGEPVGMVCFRWLDLANRAHREIAFFEQFSYEAMAALLEWEHRHVMVMNYLTVSPDWRKRRQGFGASEVLIGLATKRFLATEATALIAYTRNDRRTHELVYRHGATPLATDRIVHGIESHSIAILRPDVQDTTVPGVPAQVERLWAETEGSFPSDLADV